MKGHTELAVYETFEDVFGRRSTLDELIGDISSFSQQSVLWVCATIVTGMQLWNRPDLQPFDVYLRLLSLFFDNPLRSRFIAGYWSSNPRRFVFHRRQVLLISKLAILHCSGRGLNARSSAELFGPILLKTSDQLHYGLLPSHANSRGAERDDFARIIAEMVAVGEHASAHIVHMITRSHLMLTRFAEELRSHPDFIDVYAENQKTTGLTVEEYEAMVLGVHARFGEELVKKLFTEPRVLPLKDANFATVAVTQRKVQAFLDSLAAGPSTIATELKKKDSGPNDFTVFRKYPLVQQYYNLHLKTAWCGFLMMDNLFFLEKIQTGPYWNANSVHGSKLHRFWGAVFERYVNELMRQSCAGTKSLFIPDPRSTRDPSIQICDGIIVSGNSMVLMEYKSGMFRADTKYSGNYSILADEVEKKLVRDKEADRKKGVWQLSETVRQMFQPGTPVTISGIDLSTIKCVYPYIVTLDSIGSTIGMSPFLNTFLEEQLDRKAFPSVDIRPLFCTDIETLELVSGLFVSSSLTEILERWFMTNPSLTTPLSAIDLDELKWRENQWLQTEWKTIYKKMVSILFPDKDPELALAEAIKLSNRRRN